jgi:apolipoprotein D and lipocalin family protein
VRFAPRWLSFLPMVWGDYWVIDLDPAYTAGGGERTETRIPVDPVAHADRIASRPTRPCSTRLRSQGFDLSGLETTPQTN